MSHFGDRTLHYDAVISTRNRPEALALSIPLLIGQSRPPARLIVIDSSDDHASAAEAVATATAGWEGEVVVEASPPGLPLQRNRGLARVTAPVVVFPDDDSLFLPGALAEIMQVYEADTDGRIAAVCAAETTDVPAVVHDTAAYRMRRDHMRDTVPRRMRRWLERRVSALKPALSIGMSLNCRHPLPDWCVGRDVVAVEYMTGFRMSFRTEVIRPIGFDETLGGYALEEDVDASFTAMRSGLVVGARRAKVYHHRYPSGRGDAFARGRMEVLNRAYVLAKHTTGPLGSPELARRARRAHRDFVAAKLVSMVPGLASASGRARFAGAWAGMRAAPSLWSSAPAERRRLYCAAVAGPGAR